MTAHLLGAATAPVIDSLSATPSSVTPGSTLTIAVAAHDPDCAEPPCTLGCGLYVRADLTSWSATGGAFTSENDGVSGSPYTASADWQAPAAEGTYTVTVNLSDSGSFLCGGRKSVSGNLLVNVSTVQNAAPVIDSLVATPAQIFPGGSAELACSASDADGDPVVYSWSASAGSVVEGAQPGTATFSASAPGIVDVTCVASDPLGAAASATVGVAISAVRVERTLQAGLVTPQRVAVDRQGRVWVADRKRGDLVAVGLDSGTPMGALRLAGVAAVDVDWSDRLLVGVGDRVEVREATGELVYTLDPAESLGDVADVAIDELNQRYLALYRDAGRVVVWDASGSPVTEFGSIGTAADQLRVPSGLAVSANGNIVVADSGLGQIKVFSPAGALVLAFGSPGSGVGKFVQLADVAVAPNGVIYATDSFQAWVQAFYPDGTPREVIGAWGEGAGRLKTPVGLAFSSHFSILAVTSLNGGKVELFRVEDGDQAPTAAAVASPMALVFPPQEVGEASPQQSVTVTSVGTEPLLVANLAVSGDFTQSHDCPAVLAPGASCSVAVRSLPAARGASAGALEIATSSHSQPTLSVALSGSGFVRPTASLAPNRIEFPAVRAGETSDPVLMTFTNTSVEPLTLSDLTVSGEFAAETDCAETMAPGGTCAIAVRLAPQTGAGVMLGRLAVSSNAVGSPHIAELIGIGLDAVPQLLIGDVELDEGDDGETAARFPVMLVPPVSVTVTVDYATVANSAQPDRDYRHTAGTLAFPPGTAELEIVVPVIGDRLLEPDEETFFVELSNPVGATLVDPRVTGRLFDDERCPSRDLLIDGGAEEFPVYGGVANWHEVVGDRWQRRFAAPAPDAGQGGKAYFWPGAVAAAELSQSIDVRDYRDRLLDGVQRFAFRGLVRTAGADEAAIRVEFLDAFGNLLDAFDSGPLASVDGWLEVADERLAPHDTEWVRVRLLGWREDADDDLDAYFDALELRSLRTATIEIPRFDVYEGDRGSVQAPVPVELACPLEEEVRGLVRTRDFTARSGEDYLTTAEFFTLPSGTTETTVPVTVLGDPTEEPHEELRVAIELVQPTAALVLGIEGALRIVNDDSCALTVGSWGRLENWPVGYLTLGGLDYGLDELRALLAGGGDATTKLAQQLVATKLNLAVGTPPTILDTVVQADEFLAAHPPASSLTADDGRVARSLERRLAGYNGQACR